MKKYYLYNGSRQYGPFSYAELKHQHLLRSTPVWYEGLNEWVPAGSVEELQAIVPAAIPPPFVVSNSGNGAPAKPFPAPASSRINTRFRNRVVFIACLIICALVVLTITCIGLW
jgi:hypothetical protein